MDTNGSQDNGMGGTAHTQGDQGNNDSGRGYGGGGSNSNHFSNINQPPSSLSDRLGGVVETDVSTGQTTTAANSEGNLTGVSTTNPDGSQRSESQMEAAIANARRGGNNITTNTDQYGNDLSQSTISQTLARDRSAQAAQEAWNNHDYVSWATNKISSQVSDVEASMGTFVTSMMHNPLDTMADLMESGPMLTVSMLNPMTAAMNLGLQAVDTGFDLAQGETTVTGAMGEMATDVGKMGSMAFGMNPFAAAGLETAGNIAQGDYGTAGRNAGGMFGGLSNTAYGGMIGTVAGGLIGDSIQGSPGTSQSGGHAGGSFGGGGGGNYKFGGSTAGVIGQGVEQAGDTSTNELFNKAQNLQQNFGFGNTPQQAFNNPSQISGIDNFGMGGTASTNNMFDRLSNGQVVARVNPLYNPEIADNHSINLVGINGGAISNIKI